MIATVFPEPRRPGLPQNPLIVSVQIYNILVDFLLATPGYEELLIRRAIRYAIDDLSLWLCTAEDLIIQKAIAGRPKDWQDIEGIVIEQYASLDHRYLDDWLRQFADILENPDLLGQFQHIWHQVTTIRSAD